MDDFEDLPPRADAMIESMRAMGYNLPMAIADLIDNSIFAEAKKVHIRYGWAGSDSWISVLDDGHGMDEAQLREAMRLGTMSPLEERRPEDLGRFGLGMKTASFSQCKRLTVRSKTPLGEIATRCWDLGHVNETRRWQVGLAAQEEAEEFLEPLDSMEHGTIVLWQELDRIVHEDIDSDNDGRDVFLGKFLAVKEYLEMVFHRYLSPPVKLEISLGRDCLEPWDPYLRSNPFTQELAAERYDDGTVLINPFVLPHVSKRTSEESNSGAGPKGWNAQQGFYVYRNRRMIVSGGYLDFNLKPEEHYKLARIIVDIPNAMDQEWGIDVRKAVAIPPDRLRSELLKVARATRELAVKVYRARTTVSKTRSRKKSKHDVWLRKRIGDKIVYRINPTNEVMKEILGEIGASRSWTRKLFNAIETTVPHRLIILDNAEQEDCLVDLPPDESMPAEGLVDMCKEFYLKIRQEGKKHEEAADIVLSIEPFNTHPVFRSALDGIYEEERKHGSNP